MSFTLTILGCGSATPTSLKHPTAQHLQIAERFFLIDCGEGTQQQLRKYKVRLSKINRVFISHMHGDHYFGLIGLISSYHLLNRQNALHIYGPPELESVIRTMLHASQTRLVYPLQFHVTNQKEKTLLFEDKLVEVYSFPLKHSVPVCGFLFREKTKERNILGEKVKALNIPHFDIRKIKKGEDYRTEKGVVIPNKELTIDPPKPMSYAFCTDTAYMEKTAGFVADVDVLYHESTFLKEDISRARKTKHSTALQAAKVALSAKVGQLLLGHYSVRYDDELVFENEAKTIFKDSIATTEGMRIIASPNSISIEK